MTFGDFSPNPIYIESLFHLFASTRNFSGLFFFLFVASLSLSLRNLSRSLSLSRSSARSSPSLHRSLASPSLSRFSIVC
ncbi:hypothetical protein Scep_000115 [Stephania cephalantha]|uniref:Uncharacterized protein n=1 Tax=Stephania cephalantha TaxID=152367 RepID=A0AAP0L9N6_9MAGN